MHIHGMFGMSVIHGEFDKINKKLSQEPYQTKLQGVYYTCMTTILATET